MTGLHELLSGGLAYRLGWMLIHSLWQGAAVAVVFGLLLLMIPRAKASARYLAGCGSLLTIVILCVVSFITINPPAPDPSRATAPVQPVDDQASARIADNATPSLPGELTMATDSITDRAPDHLSTPLDSAMPIANAPAQPWGEHVLQTSRARLTPLLPWLTALWLLGVSALSLWRLGGLIATQRLRRIGTAAVSDELGALVARAAGRLRVSRPIRVLQSAVLGTPAVIGHLRPVLLLPIGALTGLSTAELDAIIAHELAHVRRHDYLVNVVQTAIETLLFHHPAVWWISRAVRTEREHCCDDLALAVCGDRLTYARALTHVQQFGVSNAGLAAAASGGRLIDRIRRLMGFPQDRRPAGWFVGLLMLVVVAAVGAGLHWAGASEAPQRREGAPQSRAREEAETADRAGSKDSSDSAEPSSTAPAGEVSGIVRDAKPLAFPTLVTSRPVAESAEERDSTTLQVSVETRFAVVSSAENAKLKQKYPTPLMNLQNIEGGFVEEPVVRRLLGELGARPAPIQELPRLIALDNRPFFFQLPAAVTRVSLPVIPEQQSAPEGHASASSVDYAPPPRYQLHIRPTVSSDRQYVTMETAVSYHELLIEEEKLIEQQAEARFSVIFPDKEHVILRLPIERSRVVGVRLKEGENETGVQPMGLVKETSGDGAPKEYLYLMLKATILLPRNTAIGTAQPAPASQPTTQPAGHLFPPPEAPPKTALRPSGDEGAADSAATPPADAPRIRVFETQGKDVFAFQSSRWRPISENEFHLTEPRLRLRLPSGEIVDLRADEGEIRVQEQKKDHFRPETAWLRGNVRGSIAPASAGQSVMEPAGEEPDDESENIIRLSCDSLELDFEKKRLQCRGSVLIKDAGSTIVNGEACQLRWDEAEPLLETEENRRRERRGYLAQRSLWKKQVGTQPATPPSAPPLSPAETRPTAFRIYDVQNLIVRKEGENDAAAEEKREARVRELETLIKQQIEPGTWAEKEGDERRIGSIQAWNDRLIVKHTESVHRQLVHVFGVLRESADQKTPLEARFKSAVKQMAPWLRDADRIGRIQGKLAEKVDQVVFRAGSTFEEVMEYLRTATQLPIDVNWNALSLVGIDRTTVVEMNLQGTTLETVLQTAVENAGSASGVELDFIVGDAIRVSTAESLIYSAVHDVRDLTDDMLDLYPINETTASKETRRAQRLQDLQDILQKVVAPGTWKAVGTMQSWNDRLIVRHKPAVHRQLSAVLDQLRKRRPISASQPATQSARAEEGSNSAPGGSPARELNEQIGTWFFDNPEGDAEQMAIFPDGRVVVLYSNGHRDETALVGDTIELAEYGGLKTTLRVLDDRAILQTSQDARGLAKIWKRIDAEPRTELLRPLTGPERLPTTQPAVHPATRSALPATQSATDEKPQERVIYVMGHVRRPGVYAVADQPMTVRRAIAAAGGVDDAHSGGQVGIVRKAPDGGEMTRTFELAVVLRGDGPDLELEPGDLLNVGQSGPAIREWTKTAPAIKTPSGSTKGAFYVIGPVKRPGVYSLTGQRISLRQAISAVGGLDRPLFAKKATCEISRWPAEGKLTSRIVDLDAILKGKSEDLWLEANDLLSIDFDGREPTDWREAPGGGGSRGESKGVYYVTGHVVRPGVYSLSGHGVTLRRAIAAAGGLDEEGGKPLRARIVRRSPDDSVRTLTPSLDETMAGREPDPALEPDDLILIRPSGIYALDPEQVGNFQVGGDRKDARRPTTRPTNVRTQFGQNVAGVFYVTGHVARPGVYSLTGQEMTLLRAIAAAGGIDKKADERQGCDIFRRYEDGVEETIRVHDLDSLMAAVGLTFPNEIRPPQDVEIQPNDVINIRTR